MCGTDSPLRTCGPQVVPPPAIRGRMAARLERRGSIRNSARDARGCGFVPAWLRCSDAGAPARVRARPATGRRYGRGSRDTTRRTARAPAVSPISASSAAACNAVPTTSAPVAGTGLRERGAAGVPAGCGGCGRGSVFGTRAARAAGRRGFSGAGFSGRAAAGCRRGAARAAAGGSPPGAAGAPDTAASPPFPGPPGRAGRFSLRRWGRVRGRALRTSGGRSSLIERHMIAHGSAARGAGFC